MQPSASRKTQLVGSSLHASAKPILQKAMPIVKDPAFPNQLTRTSCGRRKFFIVRFVVQCGHIHAVSVENGAGGCFYMKHRFFWEAPQGFSQTVLDGPTHWNHSLSHLDFHRLPMNFLWLSHGCPSISKWMSMAFPWMSLPLISGVFNGSSMDFCRISHRLPMDFHGFPSISIDFQRISHGFPMAFLWISMDFQMDVHGFSMDVHGFLLDLQWISKDFNWIPMDFDIFQWISIGLNNSPLLSVDF